MTIVVPFEGTPLSEAALYRAGELGGLLDKRVLVVSIIPNSNTRYARERGWIDEEELFDLEKVVSVLSHRVSTITPEADFEYEVAGRYAQSGEIASKVRRMARRAGADLVVVGSNNAGHVLSTVNSVGTPVTSGGVYDVLIVRTPHGERDSE